MAFRVDSFISLLSSVIFFVRSSWSRSLVSSRAARHLLAVLVGDLLRLGDLGVVELQFLLNALIADEPGDSRRRPSCRSRLAALRKRRTGQ